MSSVGKALGFGGGSPKAPDYTKLSKQDAEAQQELLKQQTYANRVNQYGPQGSIKYKPKYNKNGTTTWTQTTTLSPEQQDIYNKQTGVSSGLLGAAQSFLPSVQGMSPYLDESQLSADLVNPGESYIDASMRYMQPQLDRQKQQLDTQLANQGLMAGSEAYRNAQTDLGDQQQRAMLQAIMGGIDKSQTARAMDLQEQQTLQNYPLQLLNMLRSGEQAQMPNYQGYTPAAQGQAANTMGAAQAGYGADINNYNAELAQGQGLIGAGIQGLGLAGLAGIGPLSGLRL